MKKHALRVSIKIEFDKKYFIKTMSQLGIGTPMFFAAAEYKSGVVKYISHLSSQCSFPLYTPDKDEDLPDFGEDYIKSCLIRFKLFIKNESSSIKQSIYSRISAVYSISQNHGLWSPPYWSHLRKVQGLPSPPNSCKLESHWLCYDYYVSPHMPLTSSIPVSSSN